MKKHAILATLAMVLLVFAGTGMAQMPDANMPMPMFGDHLQFLFHNLDLTPQQQESIKSILEQCHAKNGPAMHQVHDLHMQMMGAAFSDNFDPVAFRSLLDANKGVFEDLMVGMAQTVSDVYKVLTPEQRTKLHQLMAEKHNMEQQHSAGHHQ